jgi:hypothetical protein
VEDRRGPVTNPGLGRSPSSEDERGPIGPFPNWKWVYGTVLVYGTLVILALWILTQVLDPGVTF